MKGTALTWLLRGAWLAVTAALWLSPVDDWLDERMPRVMLLQMPAWFMLGWLAGRSRPRLLALVDPRGLGGFALGIITVNFWMIPRSVGAIGSSDVADGLLHLSLLSAGFAMSAGFPRLPFVAKAALAIQGTSMVFALGTFYSNYKALLCGSFSMAQQRELGGWLLRLSPLVLVWALGAGFRALLRESPAADAAPTVEPS